MKPELPPQLLNAPPRGLPVWWTAVRPRTLSISATPVLTGTALAIANGATFDPLPMLAALLTALLIQVGTNLHNDAADYQRGNDRADRIGPLRVTAAGWASAGGVSRAAGTAYAMAVVLGIYLVMVGGWPILAIGITSLLAGWSYSGGPRPVSHTALGEVFVVCFFGIAAVGGSAWLQQPVLTIDTLLTGLAVGLPAAAVLLVNNFRDLESDVRSGRRTLVAVVGRPVARPLYSLMLMLPYGLVAILAWRVHTGVLIAFATLPLTIRAIRCLKSTPIGPELNLLLAATARTGFITGVLLALGFLLRS